ncbi:permease-like cell division protein FtsX [Streptosporangium sp. NPDC051022]|uniref:permease-like cell division protein FtsX n=1 Tax=Streptosporangium sp. NPDC051022 TaxID=3155752 RepID=UPI00343B7598
MNPVNGPDVRRVRSGVRRALLGGVAVAAALLGATGATQASASPLPPQSSPPDGPWAGGQKFSPPPAGPWPKDGSFFVFLCWNDAPWDNCHNRAITPEQRRALERKLRAMPQVAEVRFESRQEALANFREAFADDEVMLSVVEAKDMPESFVGTLRRRADVVPFRSAFTQVPGVANVAAFGGDFWAGKADVLISLCGTDCDGRGRVTRQEREAVEAKLRGMREVEQVYAEDAAHARRVASFFWVDETFGSTDFPESYYVKLVRPDDARLVSGTMARLPGVSGARVMDVD